MRIKMLILAKRQKGVSLLEALIAAVILGTGLVGMAAMQVNALKVSSNSLFRVHATDTARTLADRMRVNLPGVVGLNEEDASDNAYISAWTSGGGCGAPPASCSANSCTSAEMAAWDLYEITCDVSTGLNTLLPSAELAVTCAAAGGVVDNCQISVKWEGSDDNGQQDLILPVLPGLVRGTRK